MSGGRHILPWYGALESWLRQRGTPAIAGTLGAIALASLVLLVGVLMRRRGWAVAAVAWCVYVLMP